MTEKPYYFYPKKESRKTKTRTIRRLEKLCGKYVDMFIGAPHIYKKYRGNIEFRGTGHNFEGNDGIMEQKCNMLDLVRNTAYHYITINVLRESSSGH